MALRRTSICRYFVLAAGLAAVASAQPKSAIEFYDTTGSTAVSKFGWTGDAANGNFYIRTPNDGNGVSVKQGNVTANKFSGDGSGLTNLPASTPTSVPISSVTGLSDSLAAKAGSAATTSAIAAKANTADVYSKPQVDTALAKKADASALAAKSDTSHTHPTSKITWGTGSDGQVWKMGSNGQPAWGADLQGSGGATTIAGITGLSDSLTNHRTLIGTKANATDVYTKTNINDTVAALRTQIGGKMDASQAITSAMITNGTITDADISSSAEISYSKISGGPASLPPSGTAGGDLSGTYPNPTIGTEKVTSAQILNGTIASADLSASLNSSIANGNSGCAFTTDTNPSRYLDVYTTSPRECISVTINAPTSGYVIVTGTAAVTKETGSDTMFCIGVVTDQTSMDPVEPYLYQLCETSNSVWPGSVAFAQTRGFVVSAGPHTYRILFRKALSHFANTRVWRPMITAMFFPQRLQ